MSTLASRSWFPVLFSSERSKGSLERWPVLGWEMRSTGVALEEWEDPAPCQEAGLVSSLRTGELKLRE